MHEGDDAILLELYKDWEGTEGHTEDNLIKEGVKSLLRSEILKYYFKHKDEKKIFQYERECVDRLYEAYKALGGNSFIDDVYSEIREWEVIN